MTQVSPEIRDRGIITDQELVDMLGNIEAQDRHPYFISRDKSIVAVTRLTGKRTIEIARLRNEHVWTEGDTLLLTFNIAKKREQRPDYRTKEVALTDPLTVHILEYKQVLEEFNSEWFYPTPHWTPIVGLIVDPKRHVHRTTIYRAIKAASPSVWPHLFRETVGGEVIQKDPSIIGAFKVQRRLDLADYRTAFHYLQRFARDRIEREKME